jgi:hypothetical protein
MGCLPAAHQVIRKISFKYLISTLSKQETPPSFEKWGLLSSIGTPLIKDGQKENAESVNEGYLPVNL